MSWLTCVVDNDYEIYTEFPHQIRRKSNEHIVHEYVQKATGYIICRLNNKDYKKHRIVALQFIPNPDNLPQVDHINHNKTDYHIENLRWVSSSENCKNKSIHRGHQYLFLNELPESAESLDSYAGHDLDGVYIDYEQQKLYLFNGVRYRELMPCRFNGNIVYNVRDIENKYAKLYHKILFP